MNESITKRQQAHYKPQTSVGECVENTAVECTECSADETKTPLTEVGAESTQGFPSLLFYCCHIFILILLHNSVLSLLLSSDGLMLWQTACKIDFVHFYCVMLC